MDLLREVNVTKTGRGAIGLELHIPDPTIVDDERYGNISVQILKSDGSTPLVRPYDLLGELAKSPEGQIHLAALAALEDFIIAEVESKVLPL